MDPWSLATLDNEMDLNRKASITGETESLNQFCEEIVPFL